MSFGRRSNFQGVPLCLEVGRNLGQRRWISERMSVALIVSLWHAAAQAAQRGVTLAFALAVTIQFDHEWTRINTNENKAFESLFQMWSGSPNSDPSDVKRRRIPLFCIRVHSCSFVVPDCIVTAKK